MALEDLVLGRHLDPASFFADPEAKLIGVRFPAPALQVVETWTCIQVPDEDAPRRVLRVAAYRDGILEREVYRDPADGSLVWPISTPVVPCGRYEYVGA